VPAVMNKCVISFTVRWRGRAWLRESITIASVYCASCNAVQNHTNLVRASSSAAVYTAPVQSWPHTMHGWLTKHWAVVIL